jgi:hypothetical protein
MRAYSLASLIFLLLLLLPQLGQAQRRNALAPEAKVDSVFRKHFASIAKRADSDKTLHAEDTYFIQVLSFMSGLNDAHIQCYGPMTLTEGGLLNYKNWYTAHRSQITWDNLQRGFFLMTPSLDNVLFDSIEVVEERRYKALESLRIN